MSSLGIYGCASPSRIRLVGMSDENVLCVQSRLTFKIGSTVRRTLGKSDRTCCSSTCRHCCRSRQCRGPIETCRRGSERTISASSRLQAPRHPHLHLQVFNDLRMKLFLVFLGTRSTDKLHPLSLVVVNRTMTLIGPCQTYADRESQPLKGLRLYEWPHSRAHSGAWGVADVYGH